MEAWQFALLGGVGGLLPGLIDFHNQVQAWKLARREQAISRRGGKRNLIPFRKYYDLGPGLSAAFTHAALGVCAALFLGMTEQVQGAYGAVVVGIAAPALLAQIARIDAVARRVAGNPTASPTDSAGAEPAAPPLGDAIVSPEEATGGN